MPDKALNVKNPLHFPRCGRWTRIDGPAGEGRHEVKRFTAEVNIPKQGTCRFDMKNFQQVGTSMPNVVADRQQPALRRTHVGAGKGRHGCVQMLQVEMRWQCIQLSLADSGRHKTAAVHD
jgi:hypothetical protein